MNEKAGKDSPHLDDGEQKQAEDLAPASSLVIHEIIREQGQKEQDRATSGLLWSGLAAGLSIGFSMVAEAYLKAGLPDAPWAPLVDSFGYSLGFLIVVLGQQQLYTETALTAVIPALTHRDLKSFKGMLRVWALVLSANLVGTFIFAAFAAQKDIFTPEAYAAMVALGASTIQHGFLQTVLLAGCSGWLIGLMVWLLPGAGPARPLIIILLTYVVALCHFPHIIAGSVETSLLVISGHASVGDYLGRFLLPVLIGNTIGGTALAALLNHAPIANELDGSGQRGR
jgi:formate/nitrite transporter FocA (FNT family)